ncbi:MAG: hypothetical protein J5I53_01575 [Bradyrhizobiaceae bacterium]|nr:hypothetical protein [Bradyrhizobiaceae bacterium]
MQYRIIVTLALCALVTSCTGEFLTIHTLRKLQKGIDKQEAMNLLPAEVRGVNSFSDNGRPYTVVIYDLQTSESKSTEQRYYGKVKVTTHHTNYLYLLFQDNKLRYWGMMQDYEKSEDPEMRLLASKVRATTPNN